ncbi:MAG: Molybdopterin synthase catalytic subunit [Candidatus Heimdallarchaeota archaeon LC_2]|nr:MAG: Molybdopterin synthase catalytic subunit [Candidatus Heimdallarchaeota archaeon LC_2]
MKYNGWIAKVNSITLENIINDLDDDLKIGAITTFSGIVREISDTEVKRVVQIEIEAWEERADESMKRIAEEIGKKFKLLGVRIVHIEGEIKLGEAIVFVVLASIHRKEAFDALEEIIHAYKTKSPVWKKEIYEDGSSNWITTAKN